jgi:hypothetical protein
MAHALTVLALFDRRESAEGAAARLVQAGFPAEHVGYLEPFDVRKLKNPAKAAAKGIAAGSSSGLLIGGILAAIAVGLVPGVGPVLVAGALLPVVMGAVTGGASGAVAGGLIDSGVGGEEDPYFMEEVQAGRILVSVEVPDAQAEQKAAGLLRESTPLEVDTLGTAHLHAKLRHPRSTQNEDRTRATSR